jgi:anti-anti-sigma regulatory factor
MRITNISNDSGGLTLKVEGRVSGVWAEEFGRVFDEALPLTASARDLVVDLTGVTFIDEAGKQVLKRICRSGASVVAAGCHTRSVVDEISSCCD